MKVSKIFPLAILMISTIVIGNKPIKEPATGYFNSMQVISESKAGKEAYSQIEQKRQQFATEFKKLEEGYTKKVKELQAKQSTLAVAARQKAEEDIIKSKRELENKAKEYEEDLKIAMQRQQEKLFKDLSDAVYQCGRADNKDVMVDVATGRVYVVNPDKVNNSKTIIISMDASYDKKSKSDKKTT